MSILHIFRAYDIRGIFGSDLTMTTVVKIGQAFGTYMKLKGITQVTLGGDIRASTEIVEYGFMSGVLSTGVSVELIKQSPLGITLFNSFKKHLGASAFITASHLPPEWNGVKFYWGKGIGFSPEENEEIKSIFMSSEFRNEDAFNIGTFEEVDPLNDYLSYVKEQFDFQKTFKIAVDCGNGATSLVTPFMFEHLGFEVRDLYADADPTFPNRSSEPTEKSLQDLSKLIKTITIDFGVGFDGDGDRAVFVDELGNIISADAIGIIIAKHLMTTLQKNNVIINMECSIVMETQLKEMGANVHRIRVGHSFLSLEAEKIDAVWGIESSGHAIAPHIFLFDDALILPFLLANALESENKTLSQLVSEITLPVKERFDLPCSDETKFKVLDQIKVLLQKEEGEFSDIDGIALSTDHGRILIRVSNTSPKVRVTVESMTQIGFEQLRDKFLPIVKEELEKNG